LVEARGKGEGRREIRCIGWRWGYGAKVRRDEREREYECGDSFPCSCERVSENNIMKAPD